MKIMLIYCVLQKFLQLLRVRPWKALGSWGIPSFGKVCLPLSEGDGKAGVCRE